MMKKFAVALFAGSFALLSIGSAADAYPLLERLVTVDKPTVAPGETLTATANCDGLEAVTFDLGGTTATGTCNGTDDEGTTSGALVSFGTASAALVAPAEAGDFIVTATGSFSGDLGSTQVVVVQSTDVLGDGGGAPTTVVPNSPTGDLPATGTGGVGLTTGVALGMFILGLGLFALATLRRRQPIAD